MLWPRHEKTSSPPPLRLTSSLPNALILKAVKGNQMDRDHLMQIVQPMLAGFKLEIAKMRSEGATQAEIDLMLDEFEEV